MMRHVSLACLSAVFASQLHAQDFATALDPVSEEMLEGSRGKFLLPNGVEVMMAVQTDTSVDGQLLLRSFFTVDQGPAQLAIYAPASSQATSTGPGSQEQQVRPSDVWVSFDRESGVSLVERSFRNTAGGVTVSSGAQAPVGQSPDGSPALPLTPGGRVDTPNGAVSLDQLANGYKVSLTKRDLEVSHVFGQALGSVILNTANDRAIETSTTINLDLMNATPMNVGSAMPRVEGMALDVTRDLIH